jgi:hypothetical protein
MASSTRNWRSIAGLTAAVCFAGLGWMRWHARWNVALLSAAALMLLLAMAAPRIWEPIQATVDRAVRALMAIVTWLLLGVVFIFCFVPGRLILLALRRDPLRRAPDPALGTYWEPMPGPRGAGRFRRQF